MFNLTVNPGELVLRAVATYVFLVLILRISGKRQIGQLAPFDLVLLLVLSNAVQNSINGGDNSLVGGFISALALVGANFTVAFLTFRSKRLARLIEGRPQVLIHNGCLYEDVLRKALITRHELDAALRAQGASCVDHVRFAVLENNGEISVQLRQQP